MAVTALPIDASAGVPAYTAAQTRQAFSTLMGPAPAGRPLGASSGVRMGTPTTTVFLNGTGSMTWNVAAHSGVIDAENASAGPYLYAADGTDTGTVTAADASNPRVDIVYVQVNDTVQDGSGLRNGVVGYLAGVPAATPSPPATPARSMVLTNINVPKSGGGAPTVSWIAPTFYGADGILRQTGSVTVSGSSIAANFGTATVNITFPIPYSVAPSYVNAVPAAFVSGSTAMLIRQVDQVSTTGARVVLVNASSSNTATFTGLPIMWVSVGTP